jgi:hypothetical protein
MADGIFYRDMRMPHLVADDGSVSLSTTSLLIHSMQYTSLPANYFTVGKKLKLSLFGRFTTAATPGNLTVELRFGTTSNAGTILATSAAVALTASKTNISWYGEWNIHCRAVGASGSLFAWGQTYFEPSSAIITTSTNNPLIQPITAPAAVAVDTTAASGLNVQMKRSGSTAETVQVHDLMFEALN